MSSARRSLVTGIVLGTALLAAVRDGSAVVRRRVDPPARRRMPARISTRTPQREKFIDFALRYLNPDRRPDSELPDGPPRVWLSRRGRFGEDFTVSNHRMLLRGRVWESRTGIDGRIDDAFMRVDGTWTRIDNPFD